MIECPSELETSRIIGCFDKTAKDVFPKLDYDGYIVEKIPVYNEDATNTL